MKLLFISNIGGKKVGNFSRSSILAAQKLGIEFHFASNWDKSTDQQMKADEEEYNIKLHHIDFARNPFKLVNYKAYKQLINLIQKEQFDIVHCNTPVGGLLGRLSGRKTKVRSIIYTVHGFHFFEGAPLIKNFLYKYAEKMLANYTDAIITINQEDYMAAQKFKLRNNGKIYYLPGVGIDTSYIKEARSKRKEIVESLNVNNYSIFIISIGELNNNKNNKIVIESLGKINNPNIHYLICGTGQIQRELYALAKEHGIEKNIHFLGYRNDVAELLMSSDIFILPSYREGLSRSLMEAMSANLPCVVSNIRGNTDLIENGKGGYLCDPDDVERFKEAIEELVKDDVLRYQMGIYNQKKVEKFNLANVKELLGKIYMDVLKEELNE